MAQPVEGCVSTVLIDGNGNFNTDGMKKFEEDAKLEEQGRSCGVVAIMGPQSSGKSTLLNVLFDTDFKVLDDPFCRVQTTKGVWLAQTQLQNNCFLVLDTEGSDSAERQDNTTFERQIALLIIATSGIVMINMWFSDVGRREAAGLPLLTIVFQVMLRILKPRKVHLIFVVRDCPDLKVTDDRNEKTRSEKLKDPIERQLEEIWNKLPESKKHKNTALHDLFEIDVVALSTYNNQEERFKTEVDHLRDTIVRTLASIELTTNRTAFIQYTETIWGEIKENKDLDVPNINIMITVARKHCSNILEKKYKEFVDDDSRWTEAKDNIDQCAVAEGLMAVNQLKNTYLSEYDMETEYFDEGERSAQRKRLEEKMLQATYEYLLEPMTNATMEKLADAISDGLRKKNNLRESLDEIVEYQTKSLLNELRGQFEDAGMKTADEAAFLERLTKEINACVRHIYVVIKQEGDEVALKPLNILKCIPPVVSIAMTLLTGIPLLTGG